MRSSSMTVLAGAAAGLVSFVFKVYPSHSSTEAVTAFAGTLASIATTMLGFMLAVLAIIASISHIHLLKMMQKTGHYDDLLLTLFTSCAIFMAVATIGLILVFGVPGHAAFMSALTGLHVAALISLFDVGRKFWLVLKNIKAS